MWAPIAMAGISIYTSLAQKKEQMNRMVSDAAVKKDRIVRTINRASETRGAQYQAVRENALAATQGITLATEDAQGQVDTALADSGVTGISRDDIDRQISRESSEAQLQADREAQQALRDIEVGSKQQSANFAQEASTVGTGVDFTSTEKTAIALSGLSAGYQQYSSDLRQLTTRRK